MGQHTEGGTPSPAFVGGKVRYGLPCAVLEMGVEVLTEVTGAGRWEQGEKCLRNKDGDGVPHKVSEDTVGKQAGVTSWSISNVKNSFKYFYGFQRGWEKEIEIEMSMIVIIDWLPPVPLLLGIESDTWPCALTRNQP